MKKFATATVALLGSASLLAVWPQSEASALQTPAQAECASVSAAKGEGKFTGQVSGMPTANSFQVISGNESATVGYSSSVLVCAGGERASLGAVVPGANVVVFGPEKRNGKMLEYTATKILVIGVPHSNLPANATKLAPLRANPSTTNSGVTTKDDGTRSAQSNPAAKDDWNSASPAGAPRQDPAPPGAATKTMAAAQASQPRINLQNSDALACSSLQFSVNAPREGAGAGTAKSSMTGITCRRPVDQVAMQLMEDAMTNRRLASVTLNWQNQLMATLTNADVTSVLFTSENGSQVVEVNFAYQKAEILHAPSGTRVTF
jgi:Type VI secretion system effector, Hcp